MRSTSHHEKTTARWAFGLRALFAFVVVVLALSAFPSRARAHSTTFAVYSKYEATTSGKTIAFVFAFDKNAVLQLLERDAAHAKVEPGDAVNYLTFFSSYLFARFTVSADGASCAHPNDVSRFFWDEHTSRILAVTKFTCADAPRALTIHSVVTHDMPIAHELVGDLQYGETLVRSFFFDDNTDAQIALDAPSQPATPQGAARPRGRFAYVAMPDRERRYGDLAQTELGAQGADTSATAVDAHPFTTLRHFIGQGVLHILTGYDHVLFIITLMLAVRTWRQLAIIVTSFTAAHSVTLVLATLGLVTIPSRIIEPLIALSVLIVAVDAVVRPNAGPRVLVTFGFGLVHGFGLSNVLTGLGLAGRDLVPALLGFNVGVEVGQLLIVTPLFPLVLLLRKREAVYGRARGVICASVGVLALLWIVLRVREAFIG